MQRLWRKKRLVARKHLVRHRDDLPCLKTLRRHPSRRSSGGAIATSAVPAPSKAAPQPPSTVQTPAPALVTRHLDSDEVVSLINRGEDLIKSGDLSSARLALRRAAEADDARAALLLAGTFDPNLLEKIRFQESKADAAMARFWYERAAQLGSAEASGRLQQLANTKTNAGP